MNISLEFFPPANLDFNALLYEYEKLEHLDPSFVSVTYGAGGGAENKSLELIKALKALKKNNLDIAYSIHFFYLLFYPFLQMKYQAYHLLDNQI